MKFQLEAQALGQLGLGLGYLRTAQECAGIAHPAQQPEALLGPLLAEAALGGDRRCMCEDAAVVLLVVLLLKPTHARATTTAAPTSPPQYSHIRFSQAVLV